MKDYDRVCGQVIERNIKNPVCKIEKEIPRGGSFFYLAIILVTIISNIFKGAPIEQEEKFT